MATHTLKILQQRVSDHFGTLCIKRLKLQQHSLLQINYIHWWCDKYSRFDVIPRKSWGDHGCHSILCCDATVQLSKNSGNLSLTAKRLWARVPSCICHKCWNYHFQIGCWRNLSTVVKQNYLIHQNSCCCLHYHQKNLTPAEF